MESILLLRLRVQGDAVGYCLPTGDFLFATMGAPRWFFEPTSEPSPYDGSLLYGQSIYNFVSPLDRQRLHQYVYDVQASLLESLEAADRRSRTAPHAIPRNEAALCQKEPPFLCTIDGTSTILRIEVTATPLTFRLQRCIDAIQALSEHTRRFSDESVFIIDENEYQSIIANDAYSVGADDDEAPAHTDHEMDRDRDADASLADFAFDFQADWAETSPMRLQLDQMQDDASSRLKVSPHATMSPMAMHQF
ncbi:hypothetical protein SPRG_00363 [Saprolegnia parasitica CBS 223.65]|uniref:Uncharacterized protein n=1 Tax=Saprolegnia parasitica (strain CBS 223.65) TaxID=695850 RepID=A0A067DA43_SAPPC|nr:hypothetical protein SPRG_00363 [Saprolegnia parasitica CBS 223.65]KDO35516.1 hypothetical protein SPRG_00363 [Saprolegnia parasitica CBS 223.65]|eukprot:XP_012193852.1 hypothetical protein SPRG_00363 [Saprolegnia parasitica CBS 223.65]